MKTESISKLKLYLEPAFQSIYFSVIFISFCASVVFTTTAERLNLGTVIFLLLSVVLLYLKKETYLIINEESILIQYFAGLRRENIKIKDLASVSIIDSIGRFTLEDKFKNSYVVYLNKYGQKHMLKYLDEHHLHVDKLNRV